MELLNNLLNNEYIHRAALEVRLIQDRFPVLKKPLVRYAGILSTIMAAKFAYDFMDNSSDANILLAQTIPPFKPEQSGLIETSTCNYNTNGNSLYFDNITAYPPSSGPIAAGSEITTTLFKVDGINSDLIKASFQGFDSQGTRVAQTICDGIAPSNPEYLCNGIPFDGVNDNVLKIRTDVDIHFISFALRSPANPDYCVPLEVQWNPPATPTPDATVTLEPTATLEPTHTPTPTQTSTPTATPDSNIINNMFLPVVKK
jgi:hypothetical protein